MAASTWTKFFPDGRGLLDGSYLNRIFTGLAGIKGLEINSGGTLVNRGTFTNTGATTNSGTVTNSGTTNLNGTTVQGGAYKVLSANVTAKGSTQLGAQAISAAFPLTWVIQASTASTKGVRLPAAVTGLEISIANVGAFGVKVYPSTNGKIGGAATNAADSTVLAVNKMNTYVARNTTYWIVERGS